MLKVVEFIGWFLLALVGAILTMATIYPEYQRPEHRLPLFDPTLPPSPWAFVVAVIGPPMLMFGAFLATNVLRSIGADERKRREREKNIP